MSRSLRFLIAVLNTVLCLVLGTLILLLAMWGYSEGFGRVTLQDIVQIGLFTLLICASLISAWIVALRPLSSKLFRYASLGSIVVLLYFLLAIKW